MLQQLCIKALAEIEHLKTLSGWEGWFTPALSFPQSNPAIQSAGARHPSQPERWGLIQFPYIDFVLQSIAGDQCGEITNSRAHLVRVPMIPGLGLAHPAGASRARMIFGDRDR